MNLNVVTEVFVLVTTSVPVLMDLAGLIVKIKHAQFIVRTVGFAPCLTTNVNAVMDSMELDATKSKQTIHMIFTFSYLLEKWS